MLTRLKADPQLADIPVVMLTIMNETEMGYMLGASEYLTKPMDKERLAAVVASMPVAGATSVPGAALAGGTSGEVLVVEDDESTRQVLRRALEKQGWTVGEADNGRVALEHLANAQPEFDPPGPDDAGNERLRIPRRS